MATDQERLIQAGSVAAELGLFVWLQPRLIEADGDAIEAAIRSLGPAAEAMRTHYQAVGINLGCELTLTSRGIVPGRSFDHRGQRLARLIARRKSTFDRKLNILLARLVTAVRESFGGSLTYGAGDWETVDWTRFDYVGLDTYRDDLNADVYGVAPAWRSWAFVDAPRGSRS